MVEKKRGRHLESLQQEMESVGWVHRKTAALRMGVHEQSLKYAVERGYIKTRTEGRMVFLWLEDVVRRYGNVLGSRIKKVPKGISEHIRIQCPVHEGVYLLPGLLKGETDPEKQEITQMVQTYDCPERGCSIREISIATPVPVWRELTGANLPDPE